MGNVQENSDVLGKLLNKTNNVGTALIDEVNNMTARVNTLEGKLDNHCT